MKMGRIWGCILTSVFALNCLAIGDDQINNLTEVQHIKKLIVRSYANGAFNKLDTTAMKEGFHHEFAIYSENGEELSKYPIANWITGIEKRKMAPDFDPKKYIYQYEFQSVKQIGNSAAVEILYSKDSKKVYRDFLLLLKFESGWKIVSKVYHSYK